VGPLPELVQQAEFTEQLKRRWMDGIAAEIAEEIGVLLQHLHLAPCPGEQEAGHHSSGTATGDDQV
jgi:hypothetical protein